MNLALIHFWLDNIFTDMNVRERIREDNGSLYKLTDRISRIADKLNDDISAYKKKLVDLEQKKNDIIIGSAT